MDILTDMGGRGLENGGSVELGSQNLIWVAEFSNYRLILVNMKMISADM